MPSPALLAVLLVTTAARAEAPPHDAVGVFTSKPFVFETHSYWIEGPTGVVLIDTQFLPGVGAGSP